MAEEGAEQLAAALDEDVLVAAPRERVEEGLGAHPAPLGSDAHDSHAAVAQSPDALLGSGLGCDREDG